MASESGDHTRAPTGHGNQRCPRGSRDKKYKTTMLHVFIKKHSLVAHFFDGLDRETDIRIIRYPYDRHGRLNGLLRNIEAYLLWWLPRSWCYDEAYLAQLRDIRPDDAVLYFSMENRKTLQIIRKFVRARRQSAWFWDPIRSYRKSPLSRWAYRLWLRHSGLKAYTFDPRDAREFGIGLIEQVFRHDPVPAGAAIDRDIDLCFVGTDKGRLPDLLAWKNRFERDGLRTHFHIVADGRKAYAPQERALLTDTWIPYADNLALARRSRCLLEFLQGAQSGPTMRSLEALFFGCKLITDNVAIVDCGFYHPSRIFVIGRDRPEDLQAFLQAPFEPAGEALLARHEIRSWLRQFA
jgi:hypothetical protein